MNVIQPHCLLTFLIYPFWNFILLSLLQCIWCTSGMYVLSSKFPSCAFHCEFHCAYFWVSGRKIDEIQIMYLAVILNNITVATGIALKISSLWLTIVVTVVKWYTLYNSFPLQLSLHGPCLVFHSNNRVWGPTIRGGKIRSIWFYLATSHKKWITETAL